MSCAATSVSVSDVNRTPSASSPALRMAKFSTMPLWITASLPATCGCAFTSVGPPWVAHRVCPMAAVDSGSGRRSSSSTRFASLPAFFAVASVPVGLTSATPAESYPRYSRRRSPSSTTSRGRSLATWLPT